MKFAKVLQTESVPEWRKKYIDYKGLKKLLRQVEKANLLQQQEQINSRRNNEHGRDSITGYQLSQSLRSDSFVEAVPIPSTGDEAQGKTWSMSSLPIMKPLIERMSTRLIALSKRGSLLAPVHYRNEIHKNVTLDTLLDHLNDDERMFFLKLDEELEEISEFYELKEREAINNLKMLKLQYKEMRELRRNRRRERKPDRSDPWTTPISIVKQSLDYFTAPNLNNLTNSRSTPRLSSPVERPNSIPGPPTIDVDYKDARKKIKKAVFEFYRGAELLKNYKVLNRLGFVKILKKFDKLAGWKGGYIYMQKIDASNFVTSKILDQITKETENFYVDKFEGGMRRQAMNKLRVPRNENQASFTYHFAVWRVGLYLGVSFSLMARVAEYVLSSGEPSMLKESVSHFILEINGGFLLPIVFSLLFGLNMLAWTKARINYKFIFEFDPRENLDYRQYFELPAIAFLLLNFTLYLPFSDRLTAILPPTWFPALFVIIFFAVFFCPFPIFYYDARRWLIVALFRIFLSFFFRVEFRDFFVADILNSLSYSVVSIGIFSCVYNCEWDENELAFCNSGLWWWTPIIASLPPWWRFLQCLRRYKDTGQSYPHLLNAGKYSSSILAIIFASRYRIAKSISGTNNNWLGVWIFIQSFNSVYTILWDLLMDWSLFQSDSDNLFLRDELGFKNKWVYYFAMFTNIILRFSWTTQLMKLSISSSLLAFMIAFGEMLRRWQWNFFRVENEHISNCGQFRAIKEVPLPFSLDDAGNNDELDTIVVTNTSRDSTTLISSGNSEETIGVIKRNKSSPIEQQGSRAMNIVRTLLPHRRDHASPTSRDFEPRREQIVTGLAIYSDDDDFDPDDDEDEDDNETEDPTSVGRNRESQNSQYFDAEPISAERRKRERENSLRTLESGGSTSSRVSNSRGNMSVGSIGERLQTSRRKSGSDRTDELDLAADGESSIDGSGQENTN
ncbi:hypothetical protein G9A89_009197 [Geosiphon pyriformis]|nr:hypothetical protein G9A89_009197 [Geosiphon pyriformis]